MSEFPFYIEIVHQFRPNQAQTQNLLELLHARESQQCSNDEFHLLYSEFAMYVHKSAANKIITYQEYLQVLQPQYKLKNMHNLLIQVVLNEIPVTLQTLYFQFFNMLNNQYISQDEVSLVLLSVLNQNEIKTFNQLQELAVSTLNDLKCVKGLLPHSKFILYLQNFELDEESIKQNILQMQLILKKVKTFSQLLDDKISNVQIKEYLKYNHNIYQMRFGSEINQQMIDSIVNFTTKQLSQSTNNSLQINKIEFQNQLTQVFIEYEQYISQYLLNPIQQQEQQQQKNVKEKIINNDLIDQCTGFDIDSLIIAAEWQEIDLTGKIDIQSLIQTQVNNNQSKLVNQSWFEVEKASNSDSSLIDSHNNQLSKFQTEIQQQQSMLQQNPATSFTQNSFTLKTQKYNSKLVTAKDDDVMKKLKKVLGGMK